MASSDIITKRIHVGGLTSSITSSHIKDRFKSFGNVLDVEEIGVDGLGQHRPFTFFTIQTTPGQLKKCLNIMSGSMWRGCQLRLAEAKPRYDTRLDKERNPTKESVEERLRKRKRRVLTARGPDTGKEAQDMRIPDDTNYKTKKFWSMTEDGRLIRPIAIRPSHALPPTSVASSSTAKVSAKRRGLPARRSRIRVINPALWHPSHIGEGELDAAAEGTGYIRSDGWTFESDEAGEEDEDGRKLVGRWVGPEGVEEDVEEVWVQGRVAQGTLPIEEEENEEEADSADLVGTASREHTTSPLFASRRLSRSASPLFPGRQADLVVQSDSRSASPLFPGRAAGPPADHASEVESTVDTVLEPEPTPQAAIRERSASPPFPTRRAVKPSAPQLRAVAPPVPAPQPTVAAASSDEAVPNPLHDVAKAERSRDLGFLASFLGESVAADNRPTKGEWAGFDEDDDDDLEDIAPLRLRGGRADSEDEDEDEDMSDSSSSDSSDETDSESDDDAAVDGEASSSTTPATTTVSAPKPAVAPPPRPQSALKAMFAPAPAQSNFSLLGALDADIELDDELDIPLAPPPIRQPIQAIPELQPLTQSKKSHFDPDPSIPLFFPSFGKGGKDAMREETEKEGYEGFWRQETDEEMKEVWERDKVDLTRDWKKRYREGKKQKKRRGGANDVE